MLNFETTVLAPGKNIPPKGQRYIRPPPCKLSSEILLGLFGKYYPDVLEIEPFDLAKDNFFVQYDLQKDQDTISHGHLSDSSYSDSD